MVFLGFSSKTCRLERLEQRVRLEGVPFCSTSHVYPQVVGNASLHGAFDRNKCERIISNFVRNMVLFCCPTPFTLL